METRQSLTMPLVLNDLFSVTQAKQDHDNLSFEMSQRDDLFKSLEETCLKLTSGSQQHPNKKDMIMRTNAAMIERESLFRLWDLKNKVLESQ